MSRFGWAHSLKFEPHIQDKFHDTPSEFPFIFHAAEGTDAESFEEIFQLDHMRLLNERTVLVHGLALTSKAISLINQRGAAVVACPTSNSFLFSKTLSRDQFASFRRIALGSDSPITAMGDLLDEIHYVCSEVGLDADKIYNMVSSNAAEILHLDNGIGHITESGLADVIAVRSRDLTPGSTLINSNFTEIELVVLSGQVAMASPVLYDQLPQDCRRGMQLLEIAGTLRWIRAPLQELVTEAENILGIDNLIIGGRQVRYLGTI